MIDSHDNSYLLAGAAVEPEELAESANQDEMVEEIDKNGVKKRRKKRSRRSVFEDTYPLVIQRSFFYGARNSDIATEQETAFVEQSTPQHKRHELHTSELTHKAADLFRKHIQVNL
jgi:hypothetical protein